MAHRVFLCVLLIAFHGLRAAGQQPPKPAPASQRAQIREDRGRLRLLLRGELVGSEEFQILSSSSGWLIRGNSELRMPEGGIARVRAELRLAADGTPKAYEWSTEGQKKVGATITFEGGTAKTVLRTDGVESFSQDFFFDSPRVVILDNNLYHQYIILAGWYDWKMGGQQIFSVLIPQDLTPGTITVEAAPGGGETDTDILKVRSADLELELHFAAGRRLMRIVVPSAGVEIVRE